MSGKETEMNNEHVEKGRIIMNMKLKVCMGMDRRGEEYERKGWRNARRMK